MRVLSVGLLFAVCVSAYADVLPGESSPRPRSVQIAPEETHTTLQNGAPVQEEPTTRPQATTRKKEHTTQEKPAPRARMPQKRVQTANQTTLRQKPVIIVRKKKVKKAVPCKPSIIRKKHVPRVIVRERYEEIYEEAPVIQRHSRPIPRQHYYYREEPYGPYVEMGRPIPVVPRGYIAPQAHFVIQL